MESKIERWTFMDDEGDQDEYGKPATCWVCWVIWSSKTSWIKLVWTCWPKWPTWFLRNLERWQHIVGIAGCLLSSQPLAEVGSLMISQLYMWRSEDFLRAWHLLREPLVMQAGDEMMVWHIWTLLGVAGLEDLSQLPSIMIVAAHSFDWFYFCSEGGLWKEIWLLISVDAQSNLTRWGWPTD